jgi:hypothetical protein
MKEKQQNGSFQCSSKEEIFKVRQNNFVEKNLELFSYCTYLLLRLFISHYGLQLAIKDIDYKKPFTFFSHTKITLI